MAHPVRPLPFYRTRKLGAGALACPLNFWIICRECAAEGHPQPADAPGAQGDHPGHLQGMKKHRIRGQGSRAVAQEAQWGDDRGVIDPGLCGRRGGGQGQGS